MAARARLVGGPRDGELVIFEYLVNGDGSPMPHVRRRIGLSGRWERYRLESAPDGADTDWLYVFEGVEVVRGTKISDLGKLAPLEGP